jgi:hypothetical protein
MGDWMARAGPIGRWVHPLDPGDQKANHQESRHRNEKETRNHSMKLKFMTLMASLGFVPFPHLTDYSHLTDFLTL